MEDHGNDEAADENVEDAGDMGEAQLALRCRLLLLLALRSVVPPSDYQNHCEQNHREEEHAVAVTIDVVTQLNSSLLLSFGFLW